MAPISLPRLEARDERLVRLTVAVATSDFEALRELRRAAPSAEPDRGWREAVLQTHLFAGFPRVVEACGVLDELGGLGTPDPDELLGTEESFDAGAELFGRIYREQADGVRARLATYHPVLARWIAGHAYGRVLVRPGLDVARRELLAVACLAALGPERQLFSHLRGAQAVGVGAAALDALPQVLGELWSEAAHGRFARAWTAERGRD